MTSYYLNSFRPPKCVPIVCPTFGLPCGTYGRGIYTPLAIVLHRLRTSLATYDALMSNISLRDGPQIRHPSVHYAIDDGGDVHRYVAEADVAWGLWDYDFGNYPAPYPSGGWGLPVDYPGISPDWYVIHVGAASGQSPESQELAAPAMKAHASLLAWLCHTYSIPCDTNRIVTHETVDAQQGHGRSASPCTGDGYPLAELLARTAAILAAHGEPPDTTEESVNVREWIGPFTVGLSRISSAAYIHPD